MRTQWQPSAARPSHLASRLTSGVKRLALSAFVATRFRWTCKQGHDRKHGSRMRCRDVQRNVTAAEIFHRDIACARPGTVILRMRKFAPQTDLACGHQSL